MSSPPGLRIIRLVGRNPWGEGTVGWDESRRRFIGRAWVKDGSPRGKRIGVTATTEAEAWKKLRVKRRKLASSPAYDDRVRLDTFLRRWLDDMGPTVRDRTAANYVMHVEKHIIPALGGYRLVELRPEHVARFRDAKLAEGYSPQTVTHLMKTLRAAIAHAQRLGMRQDNPAALTRAPHIPDATARPLSTAQARTFLRHVEGDPWEAIYILALMLGMRQGEILGLRWTDVSGDADWPDAARAGVPTRAFEGSSPSAAHHIEVRRALVWLNGEASLLDTKTERSHRTLTLPAKAAAALERRRVVQNLNRIEGSRTWSPAYDKGWDLVFTDRDGYPIERTAVTRAFQRHLAALGLPKVPFHSCRHTAASWMHELGMTMRQVADVLGHSKPSLTADTYTHLNTDASAEAARRLDEVMG
jgi:integrase